MDTFAVSGLIAPVFTPLMEDSQVDVTVIPEYAQYLSKHKVNGVLVGGTTGEATSLNVQERMEILETWINETKPLGLKVIAQVGGVPLPDVIALANHAQAMKADAIMTLPELYFKPKTTNQLVDYLEKVARAAPSLPLVYYHFPMMTGVVVNMPEFFKLASSCIPTFKSVKADLGVAVQVADLLGPGQRIFIANHLLAPAALMGHESSIATVTNMFPDLVRNVVYSMKTGDLTRAKELQEELNRLVAAIVSEGEFGPSMKAAMALVTGINVGKPRSPQEPLNELQTERMARRLSELGLITAYDV